MSSERPKRALLSQFAAVAKALGHPHRLELLELIAQGERSVESVAAVAGLKIGNASQHLQQLRRAGLLTARRDGKNVFYGLSDETVLDALAALRRVAERNVAAAQRVIDGYFRERDAMEPVSRDQLLDRMRDGLVTLLDVRPEDEFAAGHLPGAAHLGKGVIERDIEQAVPETTTEIVLYCGGGYRSALAADNLQKMGYSNVISMDGGIRAWREAGYLIES